MLRQHCEPEALTLLSATAAPWYPAPSAAAEAYPRTQLSAAAQAYCPNRPTTNTLARTVASEAVCAAGVIRTPEAECWVPGPGILFSNPCADDTREEEYEGPEPLPRDDEPPRTFIVPALAPSQGKSTAGFAGSEPRVPFRGRPPELTARASLGPAPIPKPRTDELFGVIHAKLEELPEEDDPLFTAPPLHNEPPGRSTAGFAGREPKAPANDRPPDLVRALGECPHFAPAAAAYEVAAQTMPAAGGTYMDCMPRFTHYSGFAGIGAFAAAFKHLGGVCGGGFEWCPEAARVFERLNPGVRLQGDFRKLRIEDLPRCDVYDGGAPCQSYSVAGAKAGRDGRGALMFEQLQYLHHHQPMLGIFEQVPNFARFDEGELMVRFLADIREAGYTPHQQVLEARHYDACQHRERLVIVAVRDDVRQRCGEFCFPPPVTGQRPAKTILAPLVKYEGKRFASADFVRCDPVRYDSGLIKVGSVAPHTRGCTVWSEEGLLPTQRCVGQGPAGAAGLVLREGVVTEVTLEESAPAQQLPEEWVLEHGLTQEQVGNAVSLGLTFHLGVKVVSYLRPLLTERAGGGDASKRRPLTSASTKEARPSPSSRACRELRTRKGGAAKVCLHELRMTGFSRRAAKLMEWKRWSWLQRRCLRDTLSQLRTSRRATPRDLRRWLAEGLSAIARSHDGVSEELAHFDKHPVEVLWWQWRDHLWSLLRDGLQLPLLQEPDRCFKPNAPTAFHPNVDKEFERLRRMGYIEGPFEAGDKRVRCVNAALGVAKKDSPDKPRMCVNMTGSEVNANLEFIKFLYPSFDDCADLLYPGCWMGKVDLTDGFFHQRVAKASRKYLGVKLPATGEIMRYTVFPFGLAVSPHYFCAAISEVHRLLRQHPLFKGAPVLNLPTGEGYDPAKPTVYQVRPDGLPTCSVAIYVDDAMVSAPTYAHCREALGVISKIFMRLGLREKRSKRDPPTRRCQFLGIEVDTSGGSVTVRVPPAKLALIRSTIGKMVGKGGADSSVIRRQLASLVGLLSFFSKAVPASRAYLRRLYSCLHEGVEVAHDYDVDVTLTQEAKGDLLWWHAALLRFRDSQVWRGEGAKVLKQHTDASGDGWGCTIEEYGKGVVDYNYGLFTPTLSAHTSNYRELFTVYAGIRRARELHPAGEHLHLVAYTDNVVSAACANAGSSKSSELLPLVKEMGLYMVENDVTCKCVWIPGRQLIRQGADPLSRGAFPFEHFVPSRRAGFDPYHAEETEVPLFLQQVIKEAAPSLEEIRSPSDWCHEELEGRDLLLCPAPAATRSCLLHYFDAHRRHSASTSALAVVACIASSDWFRLTRYFKDHLVVRYALDGSKLVYPVLIALSPKLREEAGSVSWWQTLKETLLPFTVRPDLD